MDSRKNSPSPAVLVVAVLALTASGVTTRAEADDRYNQTGFAIRKQVTGLSYTVMHEMKTVPAQRSALSVRDADVSKRIVLTFPDGASCSDFRSFIGAGFVRNGLTSVADRTREQVLESVCSKAKIPPRYRAVIFYNADSKTTKLWVETMGTVTLQGVDAMRGLWSLWFANADDAKVRAGLTSRL